MKFIISLLQWICLVPTIGGSVYGILCMLSALRLRTKLASPPDNSPVKWPSVTILKPVCGLEKNQEVNLRSACQQDYPEFQVVFSVQDFNDPVIPLLKKIQGEFGPEKVTVAIENRQAGPNGKINNLLGGILHACHNTLVISDSDIYLKPDYLKTIIGPLTDPEVVCVCTLYKATQAHTWFEKMEQLTFNADFMANIIFAYVTGASNFCLGASIALRRSTLEEIGGLESLAGYLVEDYEMGRRIWSSGKKMVVLPYFVETVVDLKDPSQWWTHQIYWDQNTRAARPLGFFSSIVTRSIPFALMYAAIRLADPLGLSILGATLGLRLLTSAAVLRLGIQDTESLKNLAFLPLRDLAALVTWFLAFTKKTVIWRGSEFVLTHNGRLLRRGNSSPPPP
ncbi:MAG: bacteriohopanetetrol glucosamine biosynthesis glycosyltransferase HpnI [Candidatus Tectomicrobia bacterium]|uniref:Bacteriohopanetetrol glucosamine biosynthesis glycosyltransferase HpnI n=1 Tax=Tectimicrobiota bacterium TaxID=2528274 RepID=A0A933GMP2_UNCTE|nr:bacteriohopanetetrol glucosamine biosynthesis glycosyltransferase HpnI [Candidatus Tectomicrobia bacterium]